MAILDITASGRELHDRFLRLEDMTGMTIEQVIAEVGPPVSQSVVAGGQLLQWQGTGCHMALLFDAQGKFVRITHQYANYVPSSVVEEARDQENMGKVIGWGIVVVIVAIVVLSKC